MKSNNFTIFKMNNQDDIIRKFSCFLVQKVSTNGSLVVGTKTISFELSSQKKKSIIIDYQSITNIDLQASFGDVITNFEISVGDQKYNFSGIHDIQALNDLIHLRQKILQEPKVDYGFINQDKSVVQFTDLNDPHLIYSCIIPATLDQIKEKILSKTFFSEIYASFGSTDVNLEEWTIKNGYRERTIYYNKLLIIPIFGKKLLHLSELQRLFEMPKKIGISVTSDLGDTPFADCFDPQVQLVFDDKGGSVEFLCKIDVVWSKSPAVKSIIQNQTVSSTKEFYATLGNRLLSTFGGDEEEKPKEEDEEEKYEDEFAKTKKIYKIAIIALILTLILTCHFKYRNKYEKNQFAHFLIKMAILGNFLLLLVFF